MLKAIALVVIMAIAIIPGAQLAGAQTSPSPGPTNPAPNPLAKPGADIVINPTTEECEKGWGPGLKWTREQFETFCTQIKTSK